MKISIIGAGNVGSLTALRLCHEQAGEIVLVDVVKGMALGKAFDMEDARALLKNNYNILGTDDIAEIKKSDIIVVTAGLARKPGMTREELLAKNATILKNICLKIKELSPDAIVIIVTNPLDLMTYLALKVTGFKPSRLFGMGITLDAARFANLVSKDLQVAVTDIDACVIGSHGEGMMPLARFTTVKGVALSELLDETKTEALVKKTVLRGQEIVTLLGSGSAYFAPSAAVAQIVNCIARNELKTLGVSAYLNGEYGEKDVCLGVPCRIGSNGIEDIVELKLDDKERKFFAASAEGSRQLFKTLSL
ncbi:MAG: malate dehydrogenase [Candidatus Omnitrophica bacterium]|nr:malate dehydrogenase [Candidatus Omnitrophota bacterium]